MKNNFIIFIVFLSSIATMMAQRLTDMVNYPSAPQTSALYKAIAAPVSYYTGQPDISIPIYTISQDGVEVPVSISFNTSGIFVTEESTNVGLGVRLDWGGSIVRSPNGAPDERGFFTGTSVIGNLKQELPKNYSNTSSYLCFPYCSNTSSLTDLTDRVTLYHRVNEYNDPFKQPPITTDPFDLRPDDFNYNFLGNSGLFKFNQADRKFITFPLDDIKIEKTSTLSDIQKFDITTSDGVKITFGDGAIESVSKSLVTNKYTQTWFIKKITTVNNSIIDFSYVANQYWKNVNAGIEIRIPQPDGGYDAGGASEAHLYYENLIKTITFKEGKLEFIYVNDRIDINATEANFTPNGGQPAPRLSKIILYNNSNQPVKTYQFNQSYFTAISSFPAVDNNRLKLDSFTILDNASNVVEKYEFDYNTGTLPSKQSKARDHWGYYNGANNNSTLIPSSIMPTDFSTSHFGTSWSGYDNWHDYFMQSLTGNRFINSLNNKAFTIKKIKLPTGGEREFVLEDNEVRWYELFAQMKDLSNDGYDIVNQRFTVSGQKLSESTPAATAANTTSTQRYVYSDEFTVQDYEDTVLGEPNLFVRTNYVNPAITVSQLNMWEYRVEIGIEKKNGSVFTPYNGTIVYINRTDQNVTYNPITLKKIPALSNGTYRFYVKMISPPISHMDTWLNPSGQIINYGHRTDIGLAFRKKNFGNIKVGGLRVKEIIDRDGTNEYKTSYEYTTTDGFCSGHLINLPEYKEYITTATPDSNPDSQGPTYRDPFASLMTTEQPCKFYNGYRICSEAVLPLMKTQGNNVGYTNITKRSVSGSKTIKEEFIYKFTPNLFSGYLKQYYQETEPRPWQSGKLMGHKKFDNNVLISEDIFDYYGLTNETDKGFTEEINTSLITGSVYVYAGFYNDRYAISVDRRPNNPMIYQGYSYRPNLYYFDNRMEGGIVGTINNFSVVYASPPLKIPYFKSYTGFDGLKSKTTIDYLGSQTITKTENYYFESMPSNLGLTRQESTGSLNETITTKFYYPQDLISEPFMSNLVTANRVGSPVKTENLVNGVKMTEEKVVYAQDATTGNLLMPKNTYYAKFPNSFTSIPNIGQLEKKMTYDKYDTDGMLLQYTPEGGISTAIIWGYNKKYPIAKIEGATYSQVSSYAAALQTASNNGTLTQASFSTLRTNLPNAMIATYVFTPLVGVSSIADVRGYKTTFEYDTFGRLQYIRDAQGNILSENQYHYKP